MRGTRRLAAVLVCGWALTAIPPGAAGQSDGARAIVAGQQQYYRDAHTWYGKMQRRLRETLRIYGQATVQTVRQKPLVALIALTVMFAPMAFGYSSGPAFFLGLGYFVLNMFVDLGPWGYVGIFVAAVFVIFNNVFQ